MVNLKIDGKNVVVPEGTTILDAAKQAGIDIPTLCFLKEINEVGDCRMCIVEVEGRKGFATSCIQKVEEGMVVHTHTPNVLEARHTILDLIISNHSKDCLTCTRSGNCELQDLAIKFNVLDIDYKGERTEHKIDDKSPSIVRDFNKCILCRRCVATCKNVQNIGAIDCIERGFESCISTTYDHSLNDVNCTFCGQCIEACPTGALHEKENINDVWAKLKDPDTYVVVQTAPSVRVALGEEFKMEIGTNVTGKMVSALKRLGFDKVFDTNTGADFTIMEEATEFVKRFKENDNLPMTTSCCPGWVRSVSYTHLDVYKRQGDRDTVYNKIFNTLADYVENILPIKMQEDGEKYKEVVEEYNNFDKFTIGKLDQNDVIEKNLILIGISRKLFTHSLPLVVAESCYIKLLKDARNLIVDTKILRKKEKAYSLLINIIEEYNLRVLLTKIYWDKPDQREEYKEFSKKYREVEKLSIINKEEYLRQKQILFLKADLKKVYQNENRYYKIIKFYKDKLVELGAMRKLKNGCISYGYYIKVDKKLKKVVNK